MSYVISTLYYLPSRFFAVSLNLKGTLEDIDNINRNIHVKKLFYIKSELEAQRFINKFNEQIDGTKLVASNIANDSKHKKIKIQKIDSKKKIDFNIPYDDIADYNKDRSNIYKYTVDLEDYAIDHLKSFYEANQNDFKEIECLIDFVSKAGEPPRFGLDDHFRKVRGLEYLYVVGDQKVKLNQVSKLKIGITNDVNKRFYDYITHSPSKLRVLAVYPVPKFKKSYKFSIFKYRNIFVSTASNVESELKLILRDFSIYQEWFWISPKDLFKIINDLFKLIKFPIFQVTSFSNKYGDRFFIDYFDSKGKNKILMCEENEIFLMSEIYGTFENNKIKKLKIIKMNDKDNILLEEKIWDYLVLYMLKDKNLDFKERSF
jgi:hypothetical protein